MVLLQEISKCILFFLSSYNLCSDLEMSMLFFKISATLHKIPLVFSYNGMSRCLFMVSFCLLLNKDLCDMYLHYHIYYEQQPDQIYTYQI